MNQTKGVEKSGGVRKILEEFGQSDKACRRREDEGRFRHENASYCRRLFRRRSFRELRLCWRIPLGTSPLGWRVHNLSDTHGGVGPM